MRVDRDADKYLPIAEHEDIDVAGSWINGDVAGVRAIAVCPRRRRRRCLPLRGRQLGQARALAAGPDHAIADLDRFVRKSQPLRRRRANGREQIVCSPSSTAQPPTTIDLEEGERRDGLSLRYVVEPCKILIFSNGNCSVSAATCAKVVSSPCHTDEPTKTLTMFSITSRRILICTEPPLSTNGTEANP